MEVLDSLSRLFTFKLAYKIMGFIMSLSYVCVIILGSNLSPSPIALYMHTHTHSEKKDC